MKPKAILISLISAALGACSTATPNPQPTAACPMAGIYVGKTRWYLEAIYKMDVPTI